MTRVCGQCENYIGMGDWGLSCKIHYGLVGETTDAESCFDFSQNQVCKNVCRTLGKFRCSICGKLSGLASAQVTCPHCGNVINQRVSPSKKLF